MEIAQFLAKSSTTTSAAETSVVKYKNKSSSSFGDYMNSFLEVANEVKNNRRSTNFANVSKQERSSVGKFEINIKKECKTEIKKNDIAVEQVDHFPMSSMSQKEQEAFERIAVLISDGSLDAEALAELSEEQMDEVVDWVLAGANGLFEPYVEESTEAVSLEGSEEASNVFGLEDSVEALSQLDNLYSRIDDNDISENEVAAIGKLLGLEELTPIQVDKLAQAILALADKNAQGKDGEVEIDGAETNLRDLLKNVPADELVAVLEDVLEDIDIDLEIPEMPDTALKSLCTEVVNANNKMIDAAELNSKLLDGLSNNDELREQILSSVGSEVASEDLIEAVVDQPAEVVAEDVINNLAQAVLEDSTPEEIASLDLEINKTSALEVATQEVATQEVGDDTVEPSNVGIETPENIVSPEAELAVEEKAPNESKSTGNESIKSTATDAPQRDIQELAEGKDVKITVKDEVVQENIEPTAKDDVKDSAKDGLTGRAFSGDNSQNSEESELGEGDAEGDKSKNESFEDGFKDNAFAKEDASSTSKTMFNDNFADVDAKMDFKAFTPEATQTSSSSNNPYVRYSDMIENMDKLSKLMMSNSDKAMKSVTMELSPPELGKLTIEVSVKDGNASAMIKVETDGARQMLLNNIEQLKKNLEANGLKLENFEVELNKEEQQDRNQQSEFAQAQEDERNRRSKRRQNGTTSGGIDTQEEGEALDVKDATLGGVNEDGSVDIVA